MNRLSNRIILVVCFCLLFASGNLFSQVSKGFKALDEFDFFRARKCFIASLNKNPVLSNYGLAKVHYDKLNHFHSYDSAYKRINLACIAFSELPEKKRLKMYEKGFHEKKLIVLADSIFSGAFSDALNGTQPEALSRYIQNFPDSPYRLKAILLRDSAAFSDASKQNSSKAFSAFNERYPQSHLREKVQKKLDFALYTETVAVGTLDALIAFLNAYPNSEYAGPVDDLVFSKASPRGTEPELYAFVKSYPNNRNVSKAWNRLYYLFTKDQRAESVDAFKAKYPEFPYKEKIREDSALLRTRLFPVIQNERWGYCDSTGSMRIPYQFDDAEYFSENLAVVELNGKKGYINKAGFMVVMPQFTEADPFSGGRAIVETDSAAGIINTIGDWIVLPNYYSVSGPFNRLYRIEQNEKYALMDSEGRLLTPVQFDELEPFSEELAAIAIEGKAGFINTSGLIAIAPQFDEAGDFINGHARVSVDGKFGVIRSDGSWLIQAKYNDIRLVSGDVYLAMDEKKCAYFDINGKLLMRSPDYCSDGPMNTKGFHEGLCRATRKGKSGFIDKKGKWVIQPEFEQLGFFKDGMAAFRKRNKWGFMNKTGKPVIKEQYDAVFAFEDGKARVKWKGKWGLIGKDGKYLLPVQYDDIELVKSNYIVSKDGKFGLFSGTLEQIFECTLDDIHFSREKDMLEITDGGKMFLYNLAENKTIWEETLFSENPK